jgi:hypothetical protein
LPCGFEGSSLDESARADHKPWQSRRLLVPAGESDEFIGRLKGIIKIIGDIESPVAPPDAWEYD